MTETKIYKKVKTFSEGYAVVYRLTHTSGEASYECNFIDETGKLLLNEWVCEAHSFFLGVAIVSTKKGFNIVDKKGTFVLDKFYDGMLGYSDGYIRVQDRDQGTNFIDTSGKVLSETWFLDAMPFFEGFSRVRLKGSRLYNFMNTKGELLLAEGVEKVCDFCGGLARVKVGHKGWLSIDTTGKIIS